MATAAAGFEIDYYRDHGIHDLFAVDGTPVTALSYPNWDGYFTALTDLSSETTGLVVSPELMTRPKNLDTNSDKAWVKITNRSKDVAHVSADLPNATVLLGTPTFDSDGGRPHNSAVAYQAGYETGARHKIHITPIERGYFVRGGSDQPDGLRHAGIEGFSIAVCADLLQAAICGGQATELTRQRIRNMVPASARTLVTLACWGVKPSWLKDENPEPVYQGALERAIGQTFDNLPQLEEIVVVDRTPADSTIAPFNAQARRTNKL